MNEYVKIALVAAAVVVILDHFRPKSARVDFSSDAKT